MSQLCSLKRRHFVLKREHLPVCINLYHISKKRYKVVKVYHTEPIEPIEPVFKDLLKFFYGSNRSVVSVEVSTVRKGVGR